MPTNNHGQSDIATHFTNIRNKEYFSAANGLLSTLCCNDEAKRSFARARPEEERKLFVHDRLGALLLRSLDLLQAHVSETHRQLAGSLAVKQFRD
jgi:hypothetical protein